MSLIDKIKKLLGIKKEVLLEEDATGTIEDGIREYLANMQLLRESKNGSDLSYYALQKINSHSNYERGQNAKKEEKLIDKCMQKYDITRQPRDPDKPVSRWIIFSQDYNLDAIKDGCKRIYINLERKNIAEFAEKFIKGAKNILSI